MGTPFASAGSVSFGLGIRDRLGVVLGEVGRHRKRPGLEVIDAVPAFDPWGLYIFALHVKRQADHDIAAVWPMFSHPGVILFHALDQSDKGVIEPIRVV